jgi:hypothetical protein
MVAIIVEGKTDQEFLDDFIRDQFSVSREQVEFKIFKGKDNIFKLDHQLYEEIENEQDIYERLLIVVDADYPKDTSPIRGYGATEKALKKLIVDLGFGIETDYFIFSDTDKQTGCLESFLLGVLDNDQKECIEDFRGCYEYELSDKWVFNTFYKQQKHPFDYDHPNFSELKQKLQNLFEGI